MKSGWRAAGVALALGSAPAGAADTGAPGRELPRAAWLHLEAAAPEASTLPIARLRLGAEREAVYREEGLAWVEVWSRDELEWKDERTVRKRRVRARQYLNEEGVRQTGNMEVDVRARVEDLFVEEAWTLMPDGGRRRVNLDRVQLVTGSRSDIYSDVVTVVVAFEGLVPGATAVLVTRVDEDVSEWPLPWSDLFVPQGWWPIERYEFDLRWPPTMPPRELRTDAPFLDCQEGPGYARCHADQLPGVPGKGDSPIWLDVLPQIVAAEPQTWTDLVRAELSLVERSIASDAGVAQTLALLLAGASDEDEKLDRIHRFVADRVRYLGLEHGSAAVAPTPVARTLETRYADCKGKVALLVAMARRAGISAHPVLVSTSRNELEKLILPSWQYFDHMIVCVDRARGAMLCLDPTTANAPTGVLPQGLYGSVALDLREGEESPRVIDLPAETVAVEIHAENEFSCEGDVEERMQRRFTGSNQVWERGLLRSATVEERKRQARDEYQALVSKDAEPSFGWTGIDDVKQTLGVSSTTRYTAVFGRDATEYREYDSWLTHYARRHATTNEHYPWFVPGVAIRSHLAFTLCPRDRVRFVGAALDMHSEFGTLLRTIRRAPRKVQVMTTLQLRPQRIPPEKLERYRQFMDRALAQTGIWFNVERDARGGGSR